MGKPLEIVITLLAFAVGVLGFLIEGWPGTVLYILSFLALAVIISNEKAFWR
jgi:hypothetical protein